MLTQAVSALLADPAVWQQPALLAMLLGPGGNPIFGPGGGPAVLASSVVESATYTITDTGDAAETGLWLNDLLHGTNASGHNPSLDQVTFGDIVELPADAAITAPAGGFVLPYLGVGTGTDLDYITIRSSAHASLPSVARVSPLTQSALFPHLVGTGSSPVIGLSRAVSVSGSNGTHHWKFVGLDCTNSGTDICPAIVQLSVEDAASRAEGIAPYAFRFEKCFIHPKEINVAGSLQIPAHYTTSARHAIQATSHSVVIRQSVVYGAAPFEGYRYGTDLVIDDTDNTKVSSVTHGSFTSGDVGYQLVIANGGGFTKGRYNILSVSGGKAVLNAACGTTGSTGGTWGEGFVGSGDGFLMNGGLGSVTLYNNFIQSCYNTVFFGGSDNRTANTGVITASSVDLGTQTGTVTLSSLTGTTPVVGTWIAFQTTSNASPDWSRWHSAKVTGVSGLDFTLALKTGSYNAWSDAPYVTGLARWDGDNIRNVTVRGNTLVNWPAEIGTQAVYDNFDFYPKGFCEIKDGIDFLWEGNYCYSAMSSVLSCYPNNQGGSQPWVACSGQTFRYNIFHGARGAPPIVCNPGYAASSTQDYTCIDILIEHNFVLAGFEPWAGTNPTVYDSVGVTSGADGVTWRFNTFASIASIANNITSQYTKNGTFTSNVLASLGSYGFNVDSSSVAVRYATWTIEYNVLVNAVPADLSITSWLSGTNALPASVAAVGFEDTGADDYRLAAGSAYLTAGEGGARPGCDFSALYAALTDGDWPFSWTP